MMQTIVYKGTVLEQMGSGLLSRVYMPQTEGESSTELASNWRRRSTSVPLTPYGRGVRVKGDGAGKAGNQREATGSWGRKSGQLLSSLLRLVSPQWVGFAATAFEVMLTKLLFV